MLFGFNIKNLLDNFMDFMYEQNMIGFFIGTFAGIASTNLILSFKQNILDNVLTKIFKLGSLSSLFFITSILEFILMLIILYFIISLIKPYFDKRNTEIKEANMNYQTELLTTLNKINTKLGNNTVTTQ